MAPLRDIISTLPDAVLSIILSKIPIREAVRCSILSKRWKFLYTQIPCLILSPFHLLHWTYAADNRFNTSIIETDEDLIPIIEFAENIISKLLLSHLEDLEAFYLTNEVFGLFRKWKFSFDSVCEWVERAAEKKVKNLTLSESPRRETPPPPALFFCTHLVTLTIYNYILSKIPTHFMGFRSLITCTFVALELTDTSLAHFTSLCPLLEELHIIFCDGLRNPVISAPNVTQVVVRSEGLETLTVNCPNLRTMEVPGMIKDLTVNGVGFQELSSAICQLKMQQGGDLIGLKLHLEQGCDVSADRLLQIVGSFKALKDLRICIGRQLKRGEGEHMASPLLKLLESLPNLECLSMHDMFVSEVATYPVPLFLSPLSNLQRVKVDINKFDDTEITVLGCLLESAPYLHVMELLLPAPKGDDEEQCMEFMNKMLSLKKASREARICERYDGRMVRKSGFIPRIGRLGVTGLRSRKRAF